MMVRTRLGDRRIGRVAAAGGQGLVVVIDLPEHLLAAMIECAKVALCMRVVAFAEIVVHRHAQPNTGLILLRQRRDAGGAHHQPMRSHALPTLIVQLRDFLGLVVHCSSPLFRAVAHATAASLSGGERGRRSRAGRRGGESPGLHGSPLAGGRLGIPRRTRLRLALDRLGR